MKNKIVLLICLLSGSISIFSQKVESALKSLTDAYPAEKVYIQYDKDYYAAGQTVWFKAYLYSNWKPSGLSNNFYVQLTNDEGEVIGHKEYPVIGATVKGYIDLPDSLPQGSYYVRAFTPGIMNYDESLIYKKRIAVYSSKASPSTATLPAPSLALQFYPESGDLLDDMIMTVGFKAVNEKGLPVAVNGLIKLEDGTLIAPFKTYHDGIGKMQLKTRAGKKYIAEIETAEGIKKFPLPEVKQYGINLKISDEKGGKKFVITRRFKQVSEYASLMVVADINNLVVYKMDISMDDYPDAEGHIATDSLPSGIMHFTLFDTKTGLPLAERLSFVNNGEYRGKGEIGSIKVNLEKRGGNELELQFPDEQLRSCSVSVTDIGSVETDDLDNIWSTLLLSSDVKGYIYNPAWYFKQGNDSSNTGLDNLLLTHGWSRFNWKQVLSGELPKKVYTDPHMLSISGQVFDQKTNTVLTGGNITMMIELRAGKPESYTLPVDDKGRFMIDSMAYYGETKLYFDYLDKQGKDRPIAIKLDEQMASKDILNRSQSLGMTLSQAEKYKFLPNIEIHTEAKLAVNAGEKQDTAKTLQTVTVKTQKPPVEKRPVEVLNEKYTTGYFSQQARSFVDNTTDPSKDESQDALQFIINRVSQVQYVKGAFFSKHKQTLQLSDWQKNFSKSFNVMETTSDERFMSAEELKKKKKEDYYAKDQVATSDNVHSGYEVSLFLNEIQITADQLKGLRAKDIAMVKYFENFTGGGIGAVGGAIAVYTVNPDYNIKAPADYPEYSIKTSGYSVTKEFFNPDYGDPTFKQPEVDNRTTLYWSPNVMTGPEVKSVKLNFYNNDFSKALKVIVEGFDASGKLIHIEKVISR